MPHPAPQVPSEAGRNQRFRGDAPGEQKCHSPGGSGAGLSGRAPPGTPRRGGGRTPTHHNGDAGWGDPRSPTVLRVHVSAGEAAAEGDPLVVVEAMKMEMPVRAPRAGVVRVVHCREGELVPPGAVLVELE